MAKKNQWTYHTSHSFTDEQGQKMSAQTQLYQVGVYMIVNGDPALQFNIEPKAIVKMEKSLTKDAAAGKITDLTWGPEITVSDETGFFEEVTT